MLFRSASSSVVAPDISIIRGTLLVFSSRASVLIDTSTSCSFISLSYASSLDLEMSHLTPTILVDTLVGGLVPLDWVCRGCELVIANRNIVIDLISFDVILGMDWLSTYRAYIDCFKRRVTFVLPSGDLGRFEAIVWSF